MYRAELVHLGDARRCRSVVFCGSIWGIRGKPQLPTTGGTAARRHPALPVESPGGATSPGPPVREMTFRSPIGSVERPEGTMDLLGTTEKIGLVLLALMLIPLVALAGPQGLGALVGAVLLVGMVRVAGQRQE